MREMREIRKVRKPGVKSKKVKKQEKKAVMWRSRSGMEMVQVAILIALAVALGIIFRTEITQFVNNTFKLLNS